MLAAQLRRRRWQRAARLQRDGGGHPTAAVALKTLAATVMAWAQTTINKDAAAG
jgi:hypothetical protein